MRRVLSQLSWAAGEVTQKLARRSDVEHTAFSAQVLQNVVVTPQATLRPAPGFRIDAEIAANSRLFGFVSAAGLSYAIVVGAENIQVYRDGDLEATLVTTLYAQVLPTLRATVLNDLVYLYCPTVPVQVLTRVAVDNWTLTNWTFATDAARNNRVEAPRVKFAPAAVTLQASGTTGTVTLTARASLGGAAYSLFQSGHVGQTFYIRDKAVVIATVNGSTATGTAVETLSTTETSDWTEAALNSVRGYAQVLTFFQDRAHLVPAGAPNTICVSETGRHNGFAQSNADGTVLATHGMTLALIRGQRYQAIVDMQARANELAVATQAGVAVINAAGANSGYSPLNKQISWASNQGAQAGTNMLVVAEAALYVSQDGMAINEYALHEEKAGVVNLTVLSEHLFTGGIKQLAALSTPVPAVVVRLANGDLVFMTHSSREGILAPVRYRAEPGVIQEICELNTEDGDTLAAKISYAGMTLLATLQPMLSKPRLLQLAQDGVSEEPKTTWSGLIYPDGIVTVVADDTRVHRVEVSEGKIQLPEPASKIDVGFEQPVRVVSRLLHLEDPNAWLSETRLVSVKLALVNVTATRLTLTPSLGPSETIYLRKAQRDELGNVVVEVPLDSEYMTSPYYTLTTADPLLWELTAVGVLLDVNAD